MNVKHRILTATFILSLLMMGGIFSQSAAANSPDLKTEVKKEQTVDTTVESSVEKIKTDGGEYQEDISLRSIRHLFRKKMMVA